MYGSPDLVDELLRHDLVDEYRLLIYPVILGAGKHLFRDRIDTRHLRLVGRRTFGSGVVLLTYVPEGAVEPGRYFESYQWTPDQVQSLRAAEDIDRTLATVLFADVVDSTGRAAAMGDRAWRKLLDEHHRVVRAEIDRWNGRNVEFAGDGVMAIFDAPTRALRCAFGLVEAARRLGIETRVGLAHGRGRAARDRRRRASRSTSPRACSGRRPVARSSSTRTVRDLATGPDLVFRPLGAGRAARRARRVGAVRRVARLSDQAALHAVEPGADVRDVLVVEVAREVHLDQRPADPRERARVGQQASGRASIAATRRSYEAS